MGTRPWYKRYPSDAIASMIMLSAEEKGVYNTILDLIYDRGGPVPNEPRDLARMAGCSTRRFNQILTILVEKHDKLFFTDNGLIMNRRAEKEVENGRKERDKLAENGAKGADKTNEKKAAAKKNNDLDEKGPLFSERHTRSQIPDTREESISNNSLSDDFSAFYSAYPRKVGKGHAEKAYRAARKKASADELLTAAQDFAVSARGKDPKYIPHPATWLSAERWLDEEESPLGEPVRRYTHDEIFPPEIYDNLH